MTNNETSFQITLKGETKVKIGQGHAPGNRVVVGVRNKTGTEARLRLTLEVKTGAAEDALLASRDAPATFDYQGPSDSTPIAGRVVDPAENGKRKWETKSTGVAIKNEAEINLHLTQFESNTPPGAAPLTIGIRADQNGRWEDISDVPEVSVKKIVEKKDRPTVHYFNVSPDFILHAGEKKVTLSCYATGYTSLVLYKNNVQVHVWTPGGETDKILEPFEDRPSITSVYRLESFLLDADNKPVETDQRTVQVISPGWNRIVLPQGCPTRLFVANDFSTGRGDRLYGIFVNAHGQAALYSSATGVDSWRPEQGNDEFPQHMRTSPGVAYENKLWLIGGSSVDPMVISNEVWCYEKDERTGGRTWEKKEIKLNGMPPRMGHSCVVFQDQVWVLGGYNDSGPLDDLWRLDPVEQVWRPVSTTSTQDQWSPRCMFTTVVYKIRSEEELWIYGGVRNPTAIRRYSDLWATKDGAHWTPVTMKEETLPIVPDPGEPVGATLMVYPESDQERLFLMGSFRHVAPNNSKPFDPDNPFARKLGNRISSYVFEWHPGQGVWETSPVSEAWEQFQGNTYCMHSVSFNRFFFVWSLYPGDEGRRFKLNILIPA